MQDQNQFQTFPFKLYEMIEYACDYEFISAISWSADGNAFIIHDKDSMMDELAPKFFKQSKFRSFTRQLNIWGFVRTETLGGEKNGWKHKFFLKGRPDLLKDIERTEVKNGARKRSSVTKPKHSSRSSKKTTQRRKEVAVVADESSCSSSRADSQASMSSSSYKSDNAHDHSANGSTVPSSGLGVRNVPHGSALNDSDHLPISFVRYEEESYSQYPPIQGSPSFSSFSMQGCNDDTTTQVSNTEETVAMYSDDQPFNNEDLMYLASIFEKDEHRSHDDDLSSILSLNQETSLEDYISNL